MKCCKVLATNFQLFASIYPQKNLFASISRWIGNRNKGCYTIGLWYSKNLSCWTTLAFNPKFATACEASIKFGQTCSCSVKRAVNQDRSTEWDILFTTARCYSVTSDRRRFGEGVAWRAEFLRTMLICFLLLSIKVYSFLRTGWWRMHAT